MPGASPPDVKTAILLIFKTSQFYTNIKLSVQSTLSQNNHLTIGLLLSLPTLGIWKKKPHIIKMLFISIKTNLLIFSAFSK